MHIKRFEGKTLAELLEKIRAELGEDALILETRASKRGRVEVLAARPHAGGDASIEEEPPRLTGDRNVNASNAGTFGSHEDGQAVPRIDPEAAGHQVRALGAAHAYARHGGVRNERVHEPSSIQPVETGLPQTPDSASKASESSGAISRVARILARKPRSERVSVRPRAAAGSVRDMEARRAAAGSVRDMEARRAAADLARDMDAGRSPDPARDMDAWRAAADAALRASSLDERERDSLAAAPDEGQQARIEYLGRLVRSEHFSAIPLPLRELYLDLTDAEIDSNLVFKILSKMGEARMPGQFAAAPPDQLLGFLRKLVRAGGAVQAGDPPRAIALVGPTGVGKTTTVAKIAGHAAFHLRKRVALVSTDGYRIFGAQHLASYAALMGMKFENATDTDALRRVVSRLAEDCDLLLIDTSGRSPRDPEGIAETEKLLAACPDLDIHLVLAANARVRDQALALERFSTLPIRHLIFTKLDETTRRGGSFTVALKAARPVSYLGTGQEVPDDLEEATIAGLTEVIAETLQKETADA